MQFKASQKLRNPNDDTQMLSQSTKQKESPPKTRQLFDKKG